MKTNIIALYVVATILIVAGFAALINGSQFIVLERGWSMVIAGSVCFTGGIVVVAITQTIAILQNIESRLKSPSGNDSLFLYPSEAANTKTSEALSAGIAAFGAAAVAAALGKEPEKNEEKSENLLTSDTFGSFSMPPFATSEPPKFASASDVPEMAEDISAISEPLENAAAPVAEFSFPEQYFDSFKQEKPPLDVLKSEPDPFPSRFPMPSFLEREKPVAGPAPAIPAPEGADASLEDMPSFDEDPIEAPAPHGSDGIPIVIGTYSAGGNSYAMFSDGSIEANTPAGIFRFQSLEELKNFIASGGDSVQVKEEIPTPCL